ncbi:MAG: glycosyltransferase [Thermoplasmatales archaeon]
MNKTESIILIAHKGLYQNNGNSTYLMNMVSSLSKTYNVIVPSESFFKKRIGRTNKWIAKAIGVNLYLIVWVIINVVRRKITSKVIIMEDRYVLIPSLLLKAATSAKLITRISDWGKEYINSLPIHNSLKTFLSIYSFFFHLISLKASDSIIVPSEFVKNEIIQKYTGNVFVLPYMSKWPENIDGKLIITTEQNFKKDEICAVFVGDCTYAPNYKAANFLVSEVANELIVLDPAIRIILVGPGTGQLMRNIPNNVTIMDEVDDLAPIYARCQLGINPSLTLGGTSIKNIEYLLNGLLVISTNESAIGVIETNRVIISEKKNFANTIVETAKSLRESPNNYYNKDEMARIREYYSSNRNSLLLVTFINSLASSN